MTYGEEVHTAPQEESWGTGLRGGVFSSCKEGAGASAWLLKRATPALGEASAPFLTSGSLELTVACDWPLRSGPNCSPPRCPILSHPVGLRSALNYRWQV